MARGGSGCLGPVLAVIGVLLAAYLFFTYVLPRI